MPVAARFYVSEFTETAYQPDGGGKVVLVAVSRGDQNRAWASATPVGRIEMTINNPAAAQWFRDRMKAGDDVSLMFDAATVHRAADGHPFRLSEAAAGTAYGPPYCGECGGQKEDHKAG